MRGGCGVGIQWQRRRQHRWSDPLLRCFHFLASRMGRRVYVREHLECWSVAVLEVARHSQGDLMELSLSERLVLGRLTDDEELLSLLRALDADRCVTYQRELIEETQAAQPNLNKIVQLASKLAERKEGVGRYVIEAKSSIRQGGDG